MFSSVLSALSEGRREALLDEARRERLAREGRKHSRSRLSEAALSLGFALIALGMRLREDDLQLP